MESPDCEEPRFHGFSWQFIYVIAWLIYGLLMFWLGGKLV